MKSSAPELDFSERLMHQRHGEQSQSVHACRAMVAMLQSDPQVAVTESDLDCNPYETGFIHNEA
jgi:hypothetical protein